MLTLSLFVSKSEIFNESVCLFIQDFDLNSENLYVNYSSVSVEYLEFLSKLRQVSRILKSLGFKVQIRISIYEVENYYE